MTIAYNHLNLPNLFSFTGGAQSNTIEILYDAAGTKLRKTVKTGATVNYTQEYIGGIEYRDGVREAIYHAEGRVKYTSPSTTRYEYTIKDHLGNARISFSDLNGNGVVNVTNVASTNEVLQENHYYPFGLNMDGKWMNDTALDNKYQYNGKEWNDDFGLNWYNYGFRWYDPAIIRFPSVDPIINEFPYLTPYNYASNDPISKIDLWGLQGEKFYRLSGRVALTSGDAGVNVKVAGTKVGIVASVGSKDLLGLNGSIEFKDDVSASGRVTTVYDDMEKLGFDVSAMAGVSYSLTVDGDNNTREQSASVNFLFADKTIKESKDTKTGETKVETSTGVSIGSTSGIGVIGLDWEIRLDEVTPSGTKPIPDNTEEQRNTIQQDNLKPNIIIPIGGG